MLLNSAPVRMPENLANRSILIIICINIVIIIVIHHQHRRHHRRRRRCVDANGNDGGKGGESDASGKGGLVICLRGCCVSPVGIYRKSMEHLEEFYGLRKSSVGCIEFWQIPTIFLQTS